MRGKKNSKEAITELIAVTGFANPKFLKTTSLTIPLWTVNPSQAAQFKLLLLGDGNVGKTCFVAGRSCNDGHGHHGHHGTIDLPRSKGIWLGSLWRSTAQQRPLKSWNGHEMAKWNMNKTSIEISQTRWTWSIVIFSWKTFDPLAGLRDEETQDLHQQIWLQSFSSFRA